MSLVVAVGSLLVAGVALFQSSRAIEAIRQVQRAQLARGPVIDLTGAPWLGSDAADVALVEFSDYECPFCIRHFQQTMPRLVATYLKTNRIYYAFRDFPVDELHPQSIRAHEAAHCALDQDATRYWQLHARLFSAPGSHTPEQLTALARATGLDMTAFAACIDSRRSDPGIRKTSQMAVDLGATGTPSFFIGLRDRAAHTVTVVRTLSGAQPFDTFAEAIDATLAASK